MATDTDPRGQEYMLRHTASLADRKAARVRHGNVGQDLLESLRPGTARPLLSVPAPERGRTAAATANTDPRGRVAAAAKEPNRALLEATLPSRARLSLHPLP